MKKIFIIHGVNLNLLGIREKNIYGNLSLEEINSKIEEEAKKLNILVNIKQSNIEGEIVNFIHEAYYNNYNGIIINPGAYTHTSIAIMDALSSINLKVIEVHLSNIYAREDFRKISYISKVSDGIITGFSYNSYILALNAMNNLLS
ncbi:MAG: 3-dehydroquinate dehydratase [Candidatus Sericytochromatia bacterium]|nr:MAG: 3-dehydroquinate dehydratase [Candidatus Sericytochromatia bacterium]